MLLEKLVMKYGPEPEWTSEEPPTVHLSGREQEVKEVLQPAKQRVKTAAKLFISGAGILQLPI